MKKLNVYHVIGLAELAIAGIGAYQTGRYAGTMLLNGKTNLVQVAGVTGCAYVGATALTIDGFRNLIHGEAVKLNEETEKEK